MIQSKELTTRGRWTLLAIAVLVVMFIVGLMFGWQAWLAAWIGTMFKASSGAVLGAFISRVFTKLNLSELYAQDQPLAAVSQAILIGAFAIAVAFGA